MRKLLILLFIIPLFLGCSVKMADLTVVSSMNVEFNQQPTLAERNVKGSDHCFTFLWFFQLGTLDMEDAIDKALKKGDGDMLKNAVVKRRNWSLFGIISWEKITVVGDSWRNQSSLYRPEPTKDMPPGN
ncbi:hypothetical protein K8I28_14900 [bacterium]|nr:hypothetical protein [bacterium]